MSQRETGYRRGVVKASVKDTAATFVEVAVPTLAKGVIVRRPKVVSLAERLALDERAVSRLQKLRSTYGTGPILLSIPRRRQAVVLDPEDAARILDAAPSPFTPASAEKSAALGHFEADVSLVSNPPERKGRRAFNEKVLEDGCPVHSMSASFMKVVDEEIRDLLDTCGDELTWDAFFQSWYRIVRRIVLGDGARDDEKLTDMLEKLRSSANWAFLHPGHGKLNESFHKRLNEHLARAEPGTLAERIAQVPQTDETAPSHQVAHYFFAFDPGGMTVFRTLALLATHAQARLRVEEEIAGRDADGRRDLSFTRACIVETLRLYATTPAILRETTQDVEWEGGVIPKNTSILIFAPFFHRDDETDPDAHRFVPERWMHKDPADRPPLVPFSAGPGVCPARHFVPMIASAAVAAVMQARDLELNEARISSDEPLPGTLDQYTLTFKLTRR
jgi:hypothetical protein